MNSANQPENSQEENKIDKTQVAKTLNRVQRKLFKAHYQSTKSPFLLCRCDDDLRCLCK
jgi:hypothetical protein